jgi:hypothetical protein
MQNLKSFLKKYSRKWYFWIIIVSIISIISSYDEPAPAISPDVKQINKETVKYLPKLFASDIYLNLEKKGLICQDLEVGLDKLISWKCEKTNGNYYYIVTIVGQDINKIISIQATAQYYGSGNIDTELDDFLAYVASVPYEDNIPTEATSWVKKNTGKNTKADFGSGNFELLSIGRTRLLTITPTSN